MADLSRIEGAIDALTQARFDADYDYLRSTVEAALTRFGYADADQRTALLTQLGASATTATARAALTWATASREAAIIGSYEQAIAAQQPIPAEAP